jgi:hypothetical protein
VDLFKAFFVCESFKNLSGFPFVDECFEVLLFTLESSSDLMSVVSRCCTFVAVFGNYFNDKRDIIRFSTKAFKIFIYILNSNFLKTKYDTRDTAPEK